MTFLTIMTIQSVYHSYLIKPSHSHAAMYYTYTFYVQGMKKKHAETSTRK